MNKEEFNHKIKEKFDKINIHITDETSESFFNYMKLLLEWNEKMNLTAIINPDEIIVKHFLDSTTILKYISLNDRIIDVGTGAGFPGVPINIITNCNITLMDSLNKRINFLNEVVRELKLENVTLIHSRAEDLGNNINHREKYDIGISRAVAPLNVLLEYVLPCIKIGGKFICMKGPNIQEEISDSNKALEKLGGKIEKIDEITLEEDAKRSIIVIRKGRHTPKEFPRKAGKPSKEPIA